MGIFKGPSQSNHMTSKKFDQYRQANKIPKTSNANGSYALAQRNGLLMHASTYLMAYSPFINNIFKHCRMLEIHPQRIHLTINKWCIDWPTTRFYTNLTKIILLYQNGGVPKKYCQLFTWYIIVHNHLHPLLSWPFLTMTLKSKFKLYLQVPFHINVEPLG